MNLSESDVTFALLFTPNESGSEKDRRTNEKDKRMHGKQSKSFASAFTPCDWTFMVIDLVMIYLQRV